MAEFLTTSGTSYYIEKIILEAKTKLVLVSPYLQISKTFLERLKDASSRQVKITIIYGKDELRQQERESLAQLVNLDLFFSQNLHAKCYFNEKHMVITSMNMYEFSEKNNREMGVLISCDLDREVFNKATEETFSIIQSATKNELTRQKVRESGKSDFFAKQASNSQKPTKGFCIRCLDKIRYNPDKPLCKSCDSIWSVFQDYQYPEKFCHRCGKPETTTKEKPQDYDCFMLWLKEGNSGF